MQMTYEGLQEINRPTIFVYGYKKNLSLFKMNFHLQGVSKNAQWTFKKFFYWVLILASKNLLIIKISFKDCKSDCRGLNRHPDIFYVPKKVLIGQYKTKKVSIRGHSSSTYLEILQNSPPWHCQCLFCRSFFSLLVYKKKFLI